MMRTLVIVAILIGFAGFIGRQALAGRVRDRDTILGAIWHFVIKNGDKEINGDFRVYNGEIFIGTKQIGSTKGLDDDDVVMTFGGYDDLNGKAALKKIMKLPPSFRGTLNKTDGSKWEMSVRRRDR